MENLKFEKIGYFIWAFLVIISVLEGSIVLTLVNLLLGWGLPVIGIVLDVMDEIEDEWNE